VRWICIPLVPRRREVQREKPRLRSSPGSLLLKLLQVSFSLGVSWHRKSPPAAHSYSSPALPCETEPPAQAKSLLHPPPQARSAWQIFFTDRLNEAKAKVGPGDKLNVAHVAKDAGAAYAALQGAEKEYYAQKAQEAREQYAIELAAWQATLTPEDVKLENQFRANQRKAGKSRKGNLKDPNAPKKPLSAYFLFLKAIRSSPQLTKQVFEGETETTKQSMLAAKRWRSFNDDEKKVSCRKSRLADAFAPFCEDLAVN
jgi:hypothetical protein